jgi:AraC-like DNA-binding protein
MRRVVTIYLVVVLAIFVGYAALYTFYAVPYVQYLLYLYALQHLIWLLGFLRFKTLPLEPLIMMYLAYMNVSIYPLTCMFWNDGNPIAFFWFILPIIIAVIFRVREPRLWISLSLVMTIAVFFSSHFFPDINTPDSLESISNGMTVLSVLLLTALFTAASVKRYQIEEAMWRKELEAGVAYRAAKEEVQEHQEREFNLYHQLTELLEKEQVFKNPECGVQMLAKHLDTNIAYISKAINTSEYSNFNALLNAFRINYAKSMLEDKEIMSKYSIDYVCTESGYKHRSSFNTAFKTQTGMTPREYLAMLNAASH